MHVGTMGIQEVAEFIEHSRKLTQVLLKRISGGNLSANSFERALPINSLFVSKSRIELTKSRCVSFSCFITNYERKIRLPAGQFSSSPALPVLWYACSAIFRGSTLQLCCQNSSPITRALREEDSSTNNIPLPGKNLQPTTQVLEVRPLMPLSSIRDRES